MPIQNNETNNAAVNMDIEECRINHGASAQSEGSTNTDNNTNTSSLAILSSGFQLMDDDSSDMPLPMGMAEGISNGAKPQKQKIGKVEQLDNDDVGPEPPAAMLEASLNAADPDVVNKVTSDITNNLSSINQLSPPVPFNYAQFQAATDNIPDNKTDLINQLSPPTPFHPHNVPDNKILVDREMSINQLSPPVPFNFTEYEREEDDDVIKMNAKALTNQMPVVVSTSHVEPVQNVGTHHLPIILASDQSEIDPPPPVSGNHNQVPEIIRRPPPPSMLLDPFRVSDPSNITSETVETATVENATAQVVVDANSVENNETNILEAYAVDDDIYGATPLEPTLPWWKQRRTKILLGVVLLIVGSLTIALGVSLSSQSNNVGFESTNSTVTIFVTPPPTVSIAPSLSIAPSTSPPTITYECFGENDGGSDGILYSAVRSYVLQNCANDKDCEIGQIYGLPMNSWCVGSVKDMSRLFEDMDTFNEDISDWNTSSVTDMWSMFEGASLFNQDLSSFDTSSVLDMSLMFYHASSFNQDLSNFDTSSVTYMWSMFSGASAFNGDVSNFDISSVTTMEYMFAGATSFNQDLCAWRDSFPYSSYNTDIFAKSNCTYQGNPRKAQMGPFCASECESSAVVSFMANDIFSFQEMILFT